MTPRPKRRPTPATWERIAVDTIDAAESVPCTLGEFLHGLIAVKEALERRIDEAEDEHISRRKESNQR